jgi:hypothetical protein
VPGVPLPFTVDVQRRLRLRRAVETGTAFGDSTQLLARLFGTVITIELSEEYYTAAVDRFADTPSVRVVYGDSATMLPLFVRSNVPTFYFLDAHWTGGPAAGREIDNPLLDELSVLAAGHADDVIVVDDARLFGNIPEGRDQSKWPPLDELVEGLRKLKPGSTVDVIGDQVVAAPARVESLLRRRPPLPVRAVRKLSS